MRFRCLQAGVQGGCPKEVGTLLYNIASEKATKDLLPEHQDLLATYVRDGKIKGPAAKVQNSEAGAYLKTVPAGQAVDTAALDKVCGVGESAEAPRDPSPGPCSSHSPS